MRDLPRAAVHRAYAERFIDELSGQIDRFEREMKSLPHPVSGVRRLDVLWKISFCVAPIKRSLASPPESEDFKQGIALGYAIGQWLLDSLHLADQILESYFSSARSQT